MLRCKLYEQQFVLNLNMAEFPYRMQTCKPGLIISDWAEENEGGDDQVKPGDQVNITVTGASFIHISY